MSQDFIFACKTKGGLLSSAENLQVTVEDKKLSYHLETGRQQRVSL